METPKHYPAEIQSPAGSVPAYRPPLPHYLVMIPIPIGPDLKQLDLAEPSGPGSTHLPSSHNNGGEPSALLLVSSAGTHRTEHVAVELVQFQGGRIGPRGFGHYSIQP